jgi:hypothetical protein
MADKRSDRLNELSVRTEVGRKSTTKCIVLFSRSTQHCSGDVKFCGFVSSFQLSLYTCWHYLGTTIFGLSVTIIRYMQYTIWCSCQELEFPDFISVMG